MDETMIRDIIIFVVVSLWFIYLGHNDPYK